MLASDAGVWPPMMVGAIASGILVAAGPTRARWSDAIAALGGAGLGASRGLRRTAAGAPLGQAGWTQATVNRMSDACRPVTVPSVKHSHGWWRSGRQRCGRSSARSRPAAEPRRAGSSSGSLACSTPAGSSGRSQAEPRPPRTRCARQAPRWRRLRRGTQGGVPRWAAFRSASRRRSRGQRVAPFGPTRRRCAGPNLTRGPHDRRSSSRHRLRR